MMEKIFRLRHQLGGVGAAALVLLGAAAAFHFAALAPLQARHAQLAELVSRQGPSAAPEQPPSAASAHHDSAADRVAAVYAYLDKKEETTDWLAKLYGIGAAAGVQLKSANYRTQVTEGRIVRYEMVVPIAGSYAQIRQFLQRSLAEIPVMSVDQVSLRRESRSDGTVQAELRVTLHMVKS